MPQHAAAARYRAHGPATPGAARCEAAPAVSDAARLAQPRRLRHVQQHKREDRDTQNWKYGARSQAPGPASRVINNRSVSHRLTLEIVQVDRP